ncbi:MAG: hypothetical protein NVSMB18_07150 [Acetobacteraceae bacterium]
MKALLLALVAATALAGSAQAQRFSNLSGGKLMEVCTGRDPKMVEACTAYIDGVSDAASFYQRLRPSDGSRGGQLPAYVCVPSNVTGVQLRQSVLSWAQQHRDQLNRQASGVVLRALDDIYRCPGEQPRVNE